MSKKHLIYDDRLAIQVEPQRGLEMVQIVKDINKDRATTGREIKAHRRLVSTPGGNNCAHHKACIRVPGCRSACPRGRHQHQTTCGRYQEGCPNYQEEFCSDYKKSPFVCNACGKRLCCHLRHMLYDVKCTQG